MLPLQNAPTQHGGIVVPLDMFRISHLAAIVSEVLVGKARNILDAKLVLTRHPSSQIVLMTIDGSVIGDEPATFWRENADVAIAMSQMLRTQCFLYYAKTAPANERREGFVVAQRGQALAADDASMDSQPPGEGHWPVTKLCEQLRISMDDLASGFGDGPSVDVSLVEPSIDDQAALMTLAGQPPGEGEEVAPGAGAGDAADPSASATGTDATGADATASDQPKKPTVEEDLKRRARIKADEAEAMQQRADEVSAALRFSIDDLGIVVCPSAELGEPDILAPFIVSKIDGDLPAGVPSEHAEPLQGRRCDIAVRVDFLSELLIGKTPLSRPQFEEGATSATIGGKALRTMEVLAPRLGYGTLISAGKAPHVFVSRKSNLPLPEDLVAALLGG